MRRTRWEPDAASSPSCSITTELDGFKQTPRERTACNVQWHVPLQLKTEVRERRMAGMADKAARAMTNAQSLRSAFDDVFTKNMFSMLGGAGVSGCCAPAQQPCGPLRRVC